MRSLLLVLATVVLIVCGFVLYSMLHDSGGATRRTQQDKVAGPTSLPVSSADGSTTKPLVGAGSGAWVRQFDEKTARLKSQFKADRYEPLPDGTTVDVEKPVAEFMLGNNGAEGGGGFVRIEGNKGKVIMPASPVPETGSRGSAKPAAPAPPTRGQLNDVVISLFDRVVEGHTPAAPSLVVTMNNASFDNDTFLIATEAFDDPATGRRVEADEVPVKVRGRDYDFDGRGLRIQWNSLNDRLQLLEIAHGESLTVKNRATFDTMRGSTTKPAGQSPTTAPSPRKRRTGPSTTPAAATPTTKPATPYRASFEKDLVITEGDVEIASGSLMLVDFMLEPQKKDETTADAKADPAQPSRSGKRHPTTEPATAPTTAATTQPAAEQLPIIVRWSGRMRVMPLEKSDDEALGPEDQIVRLSGTPLKLRREGSTIEAAGATFRTADGSASLRSSDEVPRITLRNADGAVISTPALAYSEDGGSAVLTGPSRADIPMGSEESRENLSASWNDECRLTLTKNARDESVIRTATLAGNVAIAHPRMDLNSQTLDLAFTAPTTQPAQPDATPTTKPVASIDLEKMVATGNVTAKLKDPATGAPPRSVHAQRLEMQTEAKQDGQLLPRKIIADDRVLLAEAAQSMRAEHLEAILAPKPPPAPDEDDPEDADVTAAPATEPTSAPTTRKAGDMPELIVESLVAQGNVRLDGEKGAYATAEQLIADARDGQSEIKLQGVSTPAVVSDGKNTITGPLLKFRPQDESAEVPGPGTLRFTPESKDGKTPPPPVDVAWTGHAQLDGKTNLVDLHQGVSFKTVDADGMTTTTDAQHLQITLVDRPTTQPTTDAATTQTATTKPTTRRSTGGLGDLQDTNFLANKDPRSVKLTGDVKVSSMLLKENGEVLRHLYMESPEASYDLPSRKMIVPVPGRLLYEDHRPPEAQKDDENAGPGGNRGMTGFAWKKQLIYDDAQQQATMEGDVDINHVPDAQGGESFRIATQRVIAEMEPKPATKPATTEQSAATQPATKPAGLDSAVRLKRVIAEGGVNVKTRRFEFTATRLTYSPTTGILTAHSAPGDPITLTDEQGQVDSAIESLTWNTRTDQVSIKGGRGRVRP